MATAFVRTCYLFRKNRIPLNCSRTNNHTSPNLGTNDGLDKVQCESRYSESEELKILAMLNTSIPEKLSKFAISQVRLQELLSRKAMGPFNSLSDILKLRGIGGAAMERLCDSILDGGKKATKTPKGKNKIKGQILDPVLEADQRRNIKSACALVIDLKFVGWAQVDRENNQLSGWSIFDFGLRDDKRLQLSNIMDIVWSICQTVPRSDVYVMEASPTVLRSAGADANNPKTVHINLQKSQLVAMLASALTVIGNPTSRDVDTDGDHSEHENHQETLHHKVFYLKPTLPSRLFRTFVGNERVSSQSVVARMFDKSEETNKHDKIGEIIDSLTPLHAGSHIKQYYFNQTDVQREVLCQTLLLCVTFMELCIHKNERVTNNMGSSRNQ